MQEIQGIIPIMQTPFTEDGSAVAYDDLVWMCDATIRDGAAGICLFGYATEFWKLSDAEKDEMVKTAVKAADGRVSVIASITDGSTEIAVQTARRYEEFGVDMVMILSPGVVIPSTNQLEEHVVAVGNSVRIPSMVQYAPQNGGGLLTIEALQKICNRIQNAFYIKAEAIPIPTFVDQISDGLGDQIKIWAGNMCMFMMDLMDRGVRGFMPGVSLVPIYKAIYKAYMEGDRVKAQRIYDAMVPMICIISQTVEILVKYEKMMLVERGIIHNSYCRQPTATVVEKRFWNQFKEYREKLRAITDIGEDYI